MIEAEFVGGPRDGERWALRNAAPVRVVLPPRRPSAARAEPPAHPSELEPGYIEIRPVQTERGWRLYWPKGVGA